jgi:hypothetical protein
VAGTIKGLMQMKSEVLLDFLVMLGILTAQFSKPRSIY